MPAMIDMHSHSMGNSSLDRSDYQYIGIRGTANAMLYAGVHGWLDLYSDEKDILSYRDNRYGNHRNEAFVFAAGPCFTVPGGHCDFGARNRLINSPEQARRELIDLSQSKPNVVKVVYDHNQKKPTLDEATFKALVRDFNKIYLKALNENFQPNIIPLKENAEYHAAKEAQSHNEGRIGELEDMMGPLVFLASDAAKDVTGQIFSPRMNELFVYSQIRPIKSVHRESGWTPEAIAEYALPSLAQGFSKLERSGDVFCWDPV